MGGVEGAGAVSFDPDRRPPADDYFEGQGLTLKGAGKWRTTRCDFHGGSDSMRVNVASGGWVCMACGAKGGDVLSYHMQMHGIEFVEAAKALGAWVDDGKPAVHKPLPFSARAALEVLRFEALIVAISACDMAKGTALSADDKQRLLEAAGRIDLIASEVAR